MHTKKVRPRVRKMEVVLPGQRLGELGPQRPGPGTYAQRGKIYASIIGKKRIFAIVDSTESMVSVEAIGEQVWESNIVSSTAHICPNHQSTATIQAPTGA